MGTSQSETSMLEKYRVSLNNVEAQPEMALILADFGYGAPKITEGKALLETTRQKHNLVTTENQETRIARATFEAATDQVYAIYWPHRKRAKVVFRNNEALLKNLFIYTRLPGAYDRKMEYIKAFYTYLNTNVDILAQLAIFKILPEDITTALDLIANAEQARLGYLIEVGESQDATKNKNAAFKLIDDWMDDFYAVAKIAMEDHPQLLEALGVFVRS